MAQQLGPVASVLLKLPGMTALARRAAASYQAAVGAELRKYGLRYDDLLNEYDPEVRKTIETMPPEEAELRAKRLTRAIDVDLKKTQLPETIQAKQDIWNPYISSRVGALKQAQIERQSE
ncbi:hypothetical protein I4F81_004869 [Pyropia yezoensis]|uniref:Uncharacterized protein n=1 Tax=Pyropia yezoensis TaxID=2788 RepID=A0ACC3BX32_PYRYE|nr:hypothetical protein I4F81_004869 [Neopyropia yezoensis]